MPKTPGNTLPGDLPGLTKEEVAQFGVSLKLIFAAVKEGLSAARKEGGALTCEEVGIVIGAALPACGRLADELIADAKD